MQLFELWWHWNSSLVLFSIYFIIIALVIDSFSQQMIQHYKYLKPVIDSIASILRTNNYIKFRLRISSDSVKLNNTTMTALYIRLIQSSVNTTSSISVQCSLRNYTFLEDHSAITCNVVQIYLRRSAETKYKLASRWHSTTYNQSLRLSEWII